MWNQSEGGYDIHGNISSKIIYEFESVHHVELSVIPRFGLRFEHKMESFLKIHEIEYSCKTPSRLLLMFQQTLVSISKEHFVFLCDLNLIL